MAGGGLRKGGEGRNFRAFVWEGPDLGVGLYSDSGVKKSHGGKPTRGGTGKASDSLTMKGKTGKTRQSIEEICEEKGVRMRRRRGGEIPLRSSRATVISEGSGGKKKKEKIYSNRHAKGKEF